MDVVGLNIWDPQPNPSLVDLTEVLKVHQLAETQPVAFAQWEKLIELVDCLKRETYPGKLTGVYVVDRLHLRCENLKRRAVEVEVTWRDYGPVENGLPIFHYRLRVMEEGPTGYRTTREPRRSTAPEAAQVIMTEFGLF